jgi:hypothetical protein
MEWNGRKIRPVGNVIKSKEFDFQDALKPLGEKRNNGFVWVPGGQFGSVQPSTTSVPVSPTPTPSITPTSTQTPTPSITPTQTITPTNTGTPTQTPTNTSSPTPSITPTQTITPTNTGSPTPTPTNPFDSDASAFFSRVTAAGGTLTNTEKTAVNTLVLSMKSNSIWNSMLAIYPMVGASSAACAQNLKSSGFTGTFSAGWTFSSTGVLPNGTSAFMDTAFTPSANWTLSSQHITYYSRTATQGEYDMGSYDLASQSEVGMLCRYTDNKAYYTLGNAFQSVTNTDGRGYFVATRTSSSNSKYFKNNVLLFNNGNPTAAINSTNITLSASNRPTGPIAFGNKECAFSSIGTALDDTQVGNLTTAVQAFNTTLSRQV